MLKVEVIQGPNLNLLGTREPKYYGTETLASLHAHLQKKASRAGVAIDFFQSNSESCLIDYVQEARSRNTMYFIINPAAFTHTSIALRDALSAVEIPFIEVHLSNIYAREAFRRHSYFSDIARGTISGLGPMGYYLALDAIIHELNDRES
jgi:3-dehydroquinate dehydratase-2